jgi:phosphonate transport system substrate-binding protein
MIGPTMGGVTSLSVCFAEYPMRNAPAQQIWQLYAILPSTQPVTPIVFANFLAPNMTSVYAAVAARVGQALGRPTQLIQGTSMAQLTEPTVDVAFLCGLPYVRLAQTHPLMLEPLAAPVVDEPRYRGRPVYFSDVVARRERPYRSFADLRGKTWAHSSEDSFSGCLLTRHHLLQMGETEAFFGRVTCSGRHQTSLAQVLDGEVDASAIDSHVLAVERSRNPELARRLRVIAVLGPSTMPPVVATRRLAADLARSIRDTLCRLENETETRANLARGRIRRYVPIDDHAYDDIRHKLAAVEGSVAGGYQLAHLGA